MSEFRQGFALGFVRANMILLPWVLIYLIYRWLT